MAAALKRLPRPRPGRRRRFLLALVLTVGAVRAQDVDPALGAVRELRAAGRYREAHAACDALVDPVAAAEERLYVAWFAGDLGGALRAGLAGLDGAPERLSLLWATSRLAHDLAAGDLAQSLHARLARAVEADVDLTPDQRDEWRASVRDLGDSVAALTARGAARDAAARRARIVVWGFAVLLAAGWLVLARRARAA